MPTNAKKLETISAELLMLVEHLKHGVTTQDIEQLAALQAQLDAEIAAIKGKS